MDASVSLLRIGAAAIVPPCVADHVRTTAGGSLDITARNVRQAAGARHCRAVHETLKSRRDRAEGMVEFKGRLTAAILLAAVAFARAPETRS
jgi:hypothetical protein